MYDRPGGLLAPLGCKWFGSVAGAYLHATRRRARFSRLVTNRYQAGSHPRAVEKSLGKSVLSRSTHLQTQIHPLRFTRATCWPTSRLHPSGGSTYPIICRQTGPCILNGYGESVFGASPQTLTRLGANPSGLAPSLTQRHPADVGSATRPAELVGRWCGAELGLPDPQALEFLILVSTRAVEHV